MVICYCGFKIALTSKFCPQCGKRADDLETLPTSNLLQVGATTIMQPSDAGASLSASIGGAATTAAIDPWSPPLPTKFQKLLKAGMKPDVIIWDLFRHKTIMRNLLESLVSAWPAYDKGDVLESILDYLQTHCIVCGKRIPTAEQGTTPLCGECDDKKPHH